jgi:hypothetical protein
MRRWAEANHAVRGIEIYPTVGGHLRKQLVRNVDVRQVNLLHLMPFRKQH